MKTLSTSLKSYAAITFLLITLCLKASAVNITSFSPHVGLPGTIVTITGTDLSSPTAFSIGGKPAVILSNTGTKIVAMVMPGASSGAVLLTNANGKAQSSTNFITVVIPTIVGPQRTKLSGNDAVGAAAQGTSVAMSADGSSVIVGGNKDNNGVGAVWMYSVDNNWQQQTSKLVGTGAVGQSGQGMSVSVSSDGNTAIVGGPGDDSGKGAVWIFKRTNGAWAQSGSKITASGTTGTAPALFGASVSISADGRTFVSEAAGDNNNVGSVYVYTLNSTNTWVQQGSKLVGTGSAAGNPAITGDHRIAISADGNNIVMGGHTGNNGIGAAWIFTRDSLGVWAQQGGMLQATNAVNQPNLGSSVAITGDGNLVALGAPGDDTNKGAVWVFSRNGSTWKQQAKIKSTEAIGAAQQGSAVNMNIDGSVLIVGAKADDSNNGASWVFTRTDTTWTSYSKVYAGGTASGANQGSSVALSSTGISGILGGFGDSAGIGAAWVSGSDSTVCRGLPKVYPKVITLAATTVTPKTATINGTVDATGCYTTTVVFEYGTTPDVTTSAVSTVLSIGTSPLTSAMGLTNFSSNLKGLKPSTTYYYRITAANYVTDITYGNIMSFTTPSETDSVALANAAPGSGLTLATIPNAFTPNNDGVNDRWEMPVLGSYPNCSVKVFNRGGQVVYSSVGYSTAWDGKYNNSALPAGAYYYVIDLKNNEKTISGAVNLVK